MNAGIDKIGFYTPETYIALTALAQKRDVDPNKYLKGLGQINMAVCPPYHDIISMGANAANQILDDYDRQHIDLVLFATESGLDYSKSAATTIHRLCNIQPFARCMEVKQACYGITAVISMSLSYLKDHPDRRVLIIGSDIARYGLNTGGEPTQGAGAVALVLSNNPRVLVLHNDGVAYTEDIYDFWRPDNHEYALVDGHYSNEKYLEFFTRVYTEYTRKHQLSIDSFAALCFHIPYAKIGYKTLKTIADDQLNKELFTRFEDSTIYNRQVGNIYTGSLYLSFISLCEHSNLRAGERIGFFSYGSGAVAEFFSGTLVEGFQNNLYRKTHETLLEHRQSLSYDAYENYLTSKADQQPTSLPDHPFKGIYLERIDECKRYYNVIR